MARKVVPATPENFARYGAVFQKPVSQPLARTAQYAYWSDIVHYAVAGETEIGFCTVFQQPSLEVTEVERHLKTPEILIPFGAPLILPVLLEGDADDRVESFRMEPGEAVVIREGVWHAACHPADRSTASYYVLFRRGTPQEDVAKKRITPMVFEV